MGQHYSDPSRADDPHALPNIEVFQAFVGTCRYCKLSRGVTVDEASAECFNCTRHAPGGAFYPKLRVGKRLRWFYWYCSPGCLPDSDPVGPFATEAEALADAQDYAGLDPAAAPTEGGL